MMKAVCTDLDDTLLRSDSTVSPANYATLEALGQKGVLRVVVTGRSWEVAKKVLALDLPIDYLIFSSGGGTVTWGTQELIDKHNLTAQETTLIVKTLQSLPCDFMVHYPIPGNHRFTYLGEGHSDSDFLLRIERYKGLCMELDIEGKPFGEAAQVLVIEPPNRGVDRYRSLCKLLTRLNVIRTTSPLDKKSVWIEIFPKEVSKAQAAARLLATHQITAEHTLAIGNDYNDIDLLEWAARAFVVGNAPRELKKKFETVSTQDKDGFSQAVNLEWRLSKS